MRMRDEISFRVWSAWNAVAFVMATWRDMLAHRVGCRDCDDPYLHTTYCAYVSVSWLIWSREILHGPHRGHGYDHRLPADGRA